LLKLLNREDRYSAKVKDNLHVRMKQERESVVVVIYLIHVC